MRTTIEIPDDLFHRIKVRAAMDGATLKDVVARLLERSLQDDSAALGPPARAKRSEIPLIPEGMTGNRIAAITSEELGEIEADEDAAWINRSIGR